MRITVYGRPGCQPCRATRRVLDARQVTYTFVDVQDLSRAQLGELVHEAASNMLPIVIIRDDIDVIDAWAGYRPAKLDTLTA